MSHDDDDDGRGPEFRFFAFSSRAVFVIFESYGTRVGTSTLRATSVVFLLWSKRKEEWTTARWDLLVWFVGLINQEGTTQSHHDPSLSRYNIAYDGPLPKFVPHMFRSHIHLFRERERDQSHHPCPISPSTHSIAPFLRRKDEIATARARI